MPGDVKLSCVSRRGCHSDVPVVRELKGRVEAVSLQVRGRDMEEVGLKFDFTVLLAPYLSLFGDLSAVVVGCEAFRVAKITPVRASIRLKTISISSNNLSISLTM